MATQGHVMRKVHDHTSNRCNVDSCECETPQTQTFAEMSKCKFSFEDERKALLMLFES